MEENNSEQTLIETNPSIDQITKVPLDQKPKVKNPKRVAAGRKLADYNKKAKEKQKAVQENNEEENNTDSVDNRFFPSTSFTTIIAFIGLGLTALDLFLRYKSQSNYSRTVENNNQEPDETEYEDEDVTKIKVINGPQHIGGME